MKMDLDEQKKENVAVANGQEAQTKHGVGPPSFAPGK
jgi:hypothetical protein